MKNICILFFLIFTLDAMAVCSSPVARTNFAVLEKLTSARLNSELNTVYSRVNELPGDCITNSTVTSAKILDGTIVNADISDTAAISLTKTKYAVAYLYDQKATNTPGANISATSVWDTRELGTEVDPDGIVTLTSNSFTLSAGTYLIEGRTLGSMNHRRLKLRNTVDSVDTLYGESDIAGQASTYSVNGNFPGAIEGIFTIIGTKSFSLQEWTSTNPFDKFGLPSNLSGIPEIYAQIKITRIK